MIMRDYHIHKEHVYNIWNNCKRLQQSKKYELAEILSIDKKAKLHIPNLSSIYKSIYLNKSQDKQKKKASESKSICVSDDLSEIVDENLEAKKDTIDISSDSFSESSSSQLLIILQDSEDVLKMFKKVNIEMKKVRTKSHTITSKLATGTQPYDYTNRYSAL